MTLMKNALDLLDQSVAGRFPLTAIFQVTARCNYGCIHCYQTHDATEELTLADFARIFAELAKLGVFWVTLMGGEFYMRRDADEIVELAHQHGFSIRVKTTGHHITKKRAQRLAHAKPLQVELSIYSANHRTHDAITLQPGSLKRSLDAARRLLAHNIPVRFNTPVMQGNARDIEDLDRAAEELGVQQNFDIQIMGMEDATLDPVRLRMTSDTLAHTLTHGPVAEGLHHNCQIHSPQPVPLTSHPCGAGISTVGIAPNGDVTPCNILPIVCGNLREQTFTEIWTSASPLQKLRNTHFAEIHECKVCDLRPYCSRCYSMALLEDDDLLGPSLESCRVAVAKRDAMRNAGLIDPHHKQLPPTWSRIDANGQHDTLPTSPRAIRPPSLRILS